MAPTRTCDSPHESLFPAELTVRSHDKDPGTEKDYCLEHFREWFERWLVGGKRVPFMVKPCNGAWPGPQPGPQHRGRS